MRGIDQPYLSKL